MSLVFEWNQMKSSTNLEKHGVSFEEASSVFSDTFSATIFDPLHSSSDEDRFVTIGLSNRNRILVVVHCDRKQNIRIISARCATRRERNYYENSQENRGSPRNEG